MGTATINVKALKEVRARIEKVPAELIDMARVDGDRGCGCALVHTSKELASAAEQGLSRWQRYRLWFILETWRDDLKGEAGRAEFFRRIDELIELGESQQQEGTPT